MKTGEAEANVRGVRFLAIQGLLLLAVVAVGGYRFSQLRTQRVPPALRNEPRLIVPRYDEPLVVSDEQLAASLGKLQPKFRGERAAIASLDHALRFWGAPARFQDPQALSGEELRQILTDHRRFVEYYGRDTKPLLIDTDEGGVRYRTQDGSFTSSHYDHTLACLAEIGTPLDFPVVTDKRQTRLRAVMEQALRDFSLNFFEYEWSALIFALYLDHPGNWMTTEGQWVNFDRVAERIMRQKQPQGVCLGNHRLHALVVLLRVDEQDRILTPAGRQKVVRYLQDITRTLVATQHAEGYWDNNWATPPEQVGGQAPDKPGEGQQPAPGGADEGQAGAANKGQQAAAKAAVGGGAAEQAGQAPAAAVADEQMTDRLLATGHVLEWWALAPPEVLPERERIIRAGQWTVKAIESMSEHQLKDRYGPLSHAGRALALWRGKWPHEVALPPPAGEKKAQQP
jgi:hypothetical protein